MRKSLLLAPLLAAACGGKTASPPPPGNEVATGDTGDTGDTGGESYGGWEYGGYGGDYYGGYGYGGYEGGEAYVPPPPAPPNLVGTWKSGCVAHDKVFRQHTHVYTDKARFDVRIAEFSDAACTKRTSEVHHGGTYAFGVQTAFDSTAWELNTTIDVREITADDKKSAKAIAKACGVKKLKAKGTADVLAKGCPKLSIPACAAEFDVVALQADKVRLGAGDACAAEQRPAALDTTVDIAYVWQPMGIAECDAFVATLPKVLNCAALPAEAKVSIFDGYRQMEASIRGSLTPTSPPEAVKAVTDGCKQGNDALAQGLTAMGC